MQVVSWISGNPVTPITPIPGLPKVGPGATPVSPGKRCKWQTGDRVKGTLSSFGDLLAGTTSWWVGKTGKVNDCRVVGGQCEVRAELAGKVTPWLPEDFLSPV